jgi:hypothetical protein
LFSLLYSGLLELARETVEFKQEQRDSLFEHTSRKRLPSRFVANL